MTLENSTIETIELAGLENVLHRKMAVAFSGGLDSRILLDLLAKLKTHFAELCILHINYGLRGEEADGDEKFAREVAESYQLPIHILKVSERERALRQGEGVQEWARRIRFEFFETFVKQGFLIALAHHQNDVAENVLLRLARGSSAGNLAGMRVLAGAYYRPLLLTPKAYILSYGMSQKLQHHEDSTNAKIMYSRNFIRHEVLSRLETLFPGAAQRIAATALDASDISAYTQRELLEKLQAQNSNKILISDLLSLSLGVSLETLAAFLQQHSTVTVHLSRRLLTGIINDLRAIEAKPFLKRHLKNGCEVYVVEDFLCINTDTKKSAKTKITFQNDTSRNLL